MSSFSEGQTHQLMDALEAAKFSTTDITRLGQFSNLPGIRDVVNGRAEIVVRRHVIDCDAAPFVPDGWKVEEHIKGGEFEWNPEAISLYLSDKQQGSGWVEGNKLRKELTGMPVLNANVLDYLLAHPNLIPDEWKGKYVFFWGTIYRRSDGSLYVRYLNWYGVSWDRDSRWLDFDWYAHDPAAVRK